jgi:hypothetical protein
MKRKILLTIALLALATGTGMALVAAEGTTFPHAPHIEEGAECAQCHVLDDAGVMKPSAESCTDCHDDDVPAYISALSKRAPLRFDHAAHEGVECAQCHAKTAADEQPRGQLLVDKKGCDACHEENGVEVAGAACAKCHGKGAQEIVPPDHKQLWTVRHGKEARWRVFDQHGRQCSLCHKSDACVTCHKTTRPQDHTGLWRMRTHGTAAQWDRDRCKTCHETGGCIQCHTSTTPINHTAAWSKTHGLAAKTSDTARCNVCHQMVNPCQSCHK